MIQVHKGGNVRWPQNARCLDLCELDWVEIMTLTRHCGVVLGGNSFRESSAEKGMVLPFIPSAMSFSDVHYYVDVPAVSLFTLLTAIFAFCLWFQTCFQASQSSTAQAGKWSASTDMNLVLSQSDSPTGLELLSLTPPLVGLPAKLLGKLRLVPTDI